MKVKSIAECSKGSILQYFQSSLSYYLSLRSLFCLFLGGRFTQVVLYNMCCQFIVCCFPIMVGSHSCVWLYDIVLVCLFVFCNQFAEERERCFVVKFNCILVSMRVFA